MRVAKVKLQAGTTGEVIGFRASFDRPGISVEGEVALESGRVAFRRLAVVADDVTGATFDAIPLGELRRELRRQLVAAPSDVEQLARRIRGSRAGLQVRARGGTVRAATQPQEARDDRLAAVAELYLAMLAEHPANPIRAMAVELRKAPAQARELVRRARRFGWLTSAGQGKAGAEPGEALIQYRRQQKEER